MSGMRLSLGRAFSWVVKRVGVVVLGRRCGVWVVAVGLAAAGLSGCTSQPAEEPNEPVASSVVVPPSGQEALAGFYSQKLTWEDCDGGRCTWFEVPLDYQNPQGDKMRLRLVKMKATGKSKGALFVNPGGPGASAVQYAQAADRIVTRPIREAFDIVGFDPRGVGASSPMSCFEPTDMDRYLGEDPTPDDSAEVRALADEAKKFGQACQSKYPQQIKHVSTVEAARDMDIARALMGQEKLRYLGKSYGTFLGATYAGLFPQRVGPMVLDGALPPDLTDIELNLGQARGFEMATRSYVKSCVERGKCPLGSSVDAGMETLRRWLREWDARPLPVTEDPRIKSLSEGWASLGLAAAMYSESMWPRLTDALSQAKEGNGNGLFALARSYADREQDGSYSGNIMQVISAVNCLDRGGVQPSDSEMAKRKLLFAREAPTWGPFMVWGSVACAQWPVPASGKAEKIAAKGSGPIVVIGTTRDPATPYEWSVRLAEQLEGGHLITVEGDGHTAYSRMNNSCVDKAVDAFFLTGQPPQKRLRCS